jgi:predicted dehydrogenase
VAHGLAIYCEAPMATTAADLKAIQEAVTKAGVAFTCGLHGRSNPLYAHARNFVRSGAIQDFVGFRGQHHEKTSWYSPAVDPKDEKALNWRLDPELSLGLAGELGVHQFDVFHWYTGQYPLAVRGDGSIQLHKDGRQVHDTVHLDMEFPDDRRLRYDATIANSFQKRFEMFHGTAGAVKMAQQAGWLFKESDAPTIGFEVYAGRQQFHDEEGITLVADATKLAAQERIKNGVSLQEPPLRYSLSSFLASVQDGTETHCDVNEGARASHVAIASAEAVRTGERVEIDPDLFR